MWLFIPPENMTTFAASAFVPASEASTLAYTSQSPDIGLYVMSSETVSADEAVQAHQAGNANLAVGTAEATRIDVELATKMLEAAVALHLARRE